MLQVFPILLPNIHHISCSALIDTLPSDVLVYILMSTDIQAIYQAALRANGSIVPLSWVSGQITVAQPIRFGQQDGSYGSTCVTQIERQLVLLEVTDPDGDIVESLHVVVVGS